MIKVKGTKYYDLPDFDNLREVLDHAVATQPDAVAYNYRVKPKRRVIAKTYAAFRQEINILGSGLVKSGLCENFPPVAILGDNSYQWVLMQTAILFGLGVSVPLDKLLASNEVVSLCNRSRSKIFCYDYAHREIAQAVAEACPSVETFILLHPVEEECPELPADGRHFSLDYFMKLGQATLLAGDETFPNLPVDGERMSTILFTSGTTAQSKGVMLNQKATVTNFINGLRTLYVKSNIRCLSVLPIHHTFESTVGIYGQWMLHNTICFNDGLRYFASNLKEWDIQCILAVPLLLENIYKQIRNGIEKSGKTKQVAMMRKVVRFLLKLGIDIRRKVFKPILANLGNLEFVIAGAAALDPTIIEFFDDLDITIMLGYGMTETAPMISANTDHKRLHGSVGEVLCAVEVCIDNGLDYSDKEHPGEILVNTPSKMLGYYEDPKATAEAIDADGWVHTGDLGYFDQNGYLFLTGRKKSMIVLTNGKKVFPEEIEQVLQTIPGLSAAFVWGEENKKKTIDLCACLQINKEQLPDEQKALNDVEIGKWLQSHLDTANKLLSNYKAIHQFVWCEKGIPMTTTLKIKRQAGIEFVHNCLEKLGKAMSEASGSKLEVGDEI